MGIVLKQVLGIDVAQNELVVTFGRLMDDLAVDLVAHKVCELRVKIQVKAGQQQPI